MPASPDTCPNCGANLHRHARACPECGADERTGWSDDAASDRLGLPPDPDAFDHEAWERSEFGDRAASRGPESPAARRTRRRRTFWTWIAAALLAAIACGWLGRGC